MHFSHHLQKVVFSVLSMCALHHGWGGSATAQVVRQDIDKVRLNPVQQIQGGDCPAQAQPGCYYRLVELTGVSSFVPKAVEIAVSDDFTTYTADYPHINEGNFTEGDTAFYESWGTAPFRRFMARGYVFSSTSQVVKGPIKLLTVRLQRPDTLTWVTGTVALKGGRLTKKNY